VAFEDNCVQSNKHRPIMSPIQMFSRESTFWRYNIYAATFGDSLERKLQTTVGSWVNTRATHWRSLFLQGVSVAASPVLATIGMSVCLSVRPSVRHTLALSKNDAPGVIRGSCGR